MRNMMSEAIFSEIPTQAATWKPGVGCLLELALLQLPRDHSGFRKNRCHLAATDSILHAYTTAHRHPHLQWLLSHRQLFWTGNDPSALV